MAKKRTISLFQDSVEWHKSLNNDALYSQDKLPKKKRIRRSTNIEAKSRAIDEYRTHSKRHVKGEDYENLTQNVLTDGKSNRAEEGIGPETVSRIFKKLIRLVGTHHSLGAKDGERAIKMVCILFRFYELEEYLDKRDKTLVSGVCRKANPKFEYQLAKFMGFKVRATKQSTGWRNWKRWLHWVVSEEEEMPQGPINIPTDWYERILKRPDPLKDDPKDK